MAGSRRVLVTGGSGLLGAKLLACLRALEGVEVASAARSPHAHGIVGPVPFFRLDVVDEASVERALEASRPAVVIHTAAMTDVDACERDPETCWRVNTQGTAHLARACGRRGVRLVHLSTEYVFDGRAGPYGEDDPASPLSQYGRSKLAAEDAVRAHCPRWAVARTTVLYGQAPGVRPNFVLWLLNQLTAGRRVRVVDDQVGSPTLADNLAQMVAALALSEQSGVFNTVGSSVLDRCTFARQAAEVFGLEAELIQPASTADLRQAAPRPLQGGLRMDRFKQMFPHVPVLSTREGLQALRAQAERGEWRLAH